MRRHSYTSTFWLAAAASSLTRAACCALRLQEDQGANGQAASQEVYIDDRMKATIYEVLLKLMIAERHISSLSAQGRA